MKKKYEIKDLKKIHRVFGNPTPEKVAKLMKDAGEDDPVVITILKKIQEKCSVCRKHQESIKTKSWTSQVQRSKRNSLN